MFDRTSVPERPPTGDAEFDAFAATLADIFARIGQAGGQQAMVCSLAYFRWAAGVACGVSDRSGGYLRGVDEHMIVRPMDGGATMSIHLLEISEGTWLDAETRMRAPVRAVTDAAGTLLTTYTDIASFAHERRQNALESNLVAILAHERACSLAVAIALACALLEEIMQAFLELRAVLETEGNAQLDRYLAQLSNVIRGTLEWQRLLPRYALSPTEFAHSGSAVLAPRALHEISSERRFATVEPPDSIRWWWNHIHR